MMKIRRIIKRSLEFLAVMILVLSAGKVVQADVIWTPNDTFYNNNYEDCENLARSYTTNGANGSVVVKESPVSKKTIANLENGTDYFVSFTYTDKKEAVWGVIEFEDKTGWVPMKDMALVYDNIAFMEDHAKEIKLYEGEFDDYVFTDDPVILWTYPESGVLGAEIGEMSDMVKFSSAYIDSKGRQWGYISYYYGSEGWVCFNDPTNKEISASGAPRATIIPPNTDNTIDETGTNHNSEVILLVVLVGILVLGTVILIRIFWKKKA